MRKILLFLLVILSFQAFGQTPPGYQTRIVRERIQGSFMVDSALHIPRYNGTPVGVRVGSSVQDGAIAMDTLNHLFYYYSGGVWRTVTGDNFANADLTFTGDRTHSANYKKSNIFFLNWWVTGSGTVPRFTQIFHDSTYIEFFARKDASSNDVKIFPDSSTSTKIISYATNINGSLTPNAHATKSYVDSVAAASAPTLQTVTTAGQETTDYIGVEELRIWPTFSGSRYTSNWVGNLGYSGNGVSAYGNLTFRENSTGGGNTVTLSPVNSIPSSFEIFLPPGNSGDTLATLADVRAGGGGGSGTISRIGILDSLVKVANGMQISGVSIIPQSADSTYAGLLKNIDYNRSYKLKQNYNPTGTVTINIDSAAQVIWYLTSTGGRTLAFSNLRRGDIAILSFDNTSGSNITLTLPSNSYVNLVSAATAVIPADKSSLGLALYDGTNYWFTQSLTGGGTSFVQDGNSFGASAVLGTNDNNTLSFEINNTQRLKIGTSPTRRLQLGDLSLSATSTPEQFSMGGTYNDALGVSPKLKILDDGTNISGIGFGLSGTAEQSYYLSSATWHHTFYGGAVKILDMIPNLKKVIIGDGTTTVNDPYNLAFGTDISFSPLIGLKISLYDNGASSSGFGISNGTGTTQVNYVAASTIYHSFYNNGAKTFNLTSSQGNFTGKVYIGDSATTPTARLHINAGATAASSAPLKFTLGPFQTTAEAGAMEYDSLKLTMTNATAIRQEVPLIQQSRVTTQFDKTNQTLENITGLTGTLAAGRSYRFEATLYTSSDVTGGIKVAIAGTSTATSIIYEAQVFNGGVTVATGQQRTTTQGNAVGDVTAVTAAYVKITGTITVNAAGTLTVQSARNAATGTTSVLTGSTFVITQML